MAISPVVEAARRALGPVGVFLPLPFTHTPEVARQHAAVAALDAAGYRAMWTNEGVGGRDALVQLALLLAGSERTVFGTGIANPWARAPQTMRAASAQLAEAFPGRFVLGIGVGHPPQAEAVGQAFGKPVATLRGYLERMGGPGMPLPPPDTPVPTLVGANGPRMAALGGELADGIVPAMTPPAFVAESRAALGPDKLIVSLVRVHLAPAEDHPADDAGTVTTRLREHLDAGADHVVLLGQAGADFETDVARLAALAPTDLMRD